MATKHLIILHGALGCMDQFRNLRPSLENHFHLHYINFEGHDKFPFTDASPPFNVKTFTKNVINYINKNNLESANIFGYSLGGYVGLLTALALPEKINKVFSLSTKFFWTREIAIKEANHLEPDKIESEFSQFAGLLQERFGAAHWRELIQGTRDYIMQLGHEDLLTPSKLKSLEIPVRLAVGDRDNMADLNACQEAYSYLPKGEFCVIPRTGHIYEKMPMELLVPQVIDFFKY